MESLLKKDNTIIFNKELTLRMLEENKINLYFV